jgi:hypothetical protein
MAEKQASEEGLHIKYVGGDALWVNRAVLFFASAIALAVACWVSTIGVSAATVSRTMTWLALPWFVALYFLSRKLRQIAERGFEFVLNFRMAPAYATSFVVILTLIYQFSNKHW